MATPTVSAGDGPTGIAVSPDGKSVYVTNVFADGADGVSQYSVGAGGALTAMATPTVAAGGEPFGIAVSPDGKSVYVTNEFADGADGVSQYSVGTGGALTAMATPTVAAGDAPTGIAVSPDGKSVYVTNLDADGADGVSQYSVGASGALTAMAIPTVGAGGEPVGIAVSPDGKSVYVTNEETDGADGVSEYDADTGGALSPKTPPTVAAGDEPGEIAVSPDQGPVAAFSAAAGPAGSVTSFDGSASRAPDGVVASYAWSFGHGTSVTTSSPTVTHVYARAGSYTAVLMVTDDAGCSTAFVSTGQTASCNGRPKAQTTRRVTVPAASVEAPAMPSVHISSPAGAARYTLGQLVVAGYSCREGTGGPGIASCAGPVADGQPIDTSTVGEHTFTVTATSKDGRTAISTMRYTVVAPDNQFTVSQIRTHHHGTISFRVNVPGPGSVGVLETAWDDNLARAAALLRPAARRFVFARAHRTARDEGSLKLRVTPNKRGERLVHHHAYPVTLRLWVTCTATGGKQRKQGFYSLHLRK